ncbi:hypothetical protein [Paenibacillus camelliae]|uniref:hypothetical protein n=1 Tax=Paenibacillus camelliae TaxID=512410 RepID=UPI00203E250C|nr:hypothetical protein [Paenibacillus camelliae]MCM3633337.1 hypothetical protein [Paenibacillus camelliae]
MLRKACAVSCVALVTLALLLSSAQQAAAAVNGETISLTREKILELAAKNDMTVREQNLQVKANEAQLFYANDQRIELGAYSKPELQSLPTELDELRALVPGYDDLSEAEKSEVDGALMIQSMINASMNEMVEAQANYEYMAGHQQWLTQVRALGEEINNGTHQLKIAKLEQNKQVLLAQYAALSHYYELIELAIDIRAAQLEVQIAETAYKDAEKLYQLGISTAKEVEQAKHTAIQHKKSVEQLSRQQHEQKQRFKQSLGIKAEDSIILPAIDEVKLDVQDDEAVVDIKKQIDYVKAEESINQIKTKLEEAQTSGMNKYLNALLKIETERVTLLEEWLQQKVDMLSYEKETVEHRIQQLENEYTLLCSKLNDADKLLTLGSISTREHEAVSHELARLQFNLEKSKLEWFRWQEKERIAVLGVLQ